MLYEYPEEFIVSIIYTDIFEGDDNSENNHMTDKEKTKGNNEEDDDYTNYVDQFAESDEEYAKKETKGKK